MSETILARADRMDRQTRHALERARRFSGDWRSWLSDVWAVLSRATTLHRAWQQGYDAHTTDESVRRANGGL